MCILNCVFINCIILIYFLQGIVVLSLAQGQAILTYPPDISNSFPTDFQDFVEKCLVVEDAKRATIEQLLEHEFIKVRIITTNCISYILNACLICYVFE